MIAYTMDRLLTQVAVVERDTDVKDAFGGELKAERVVNGTLRCRFWWWREGGARSSSKEYATPSRTINFTGGGVLLPKGADIEDGDWIAEIQDENGNTLIEGPFRCVAVEQQDTHTESALMRP